jgi:hypothetical protein
VDVGALSGVAARIDPPKSASRTDSSGGEDEFTVANIVLRAAMKIEIEVKRIGSKLDSIEHATFKRGSPLAVAPAVRELQRHAA